MKIKSLIIMIFIIVFTNSCNNTDDYMFGYPELIIQNSLENIYDSARVIIYASNYHEDEYDHFDRWDTVNNNKFGLCKNVIECGLKMSEFMKYDDTVVFKFYYYYQDTSHLVFPKNSRGITTVIYIAKDSCYYRLQQGFWYSNDFFAEQKRWDNDTSEIKIPFVDSLYIKKMSKERIGFPKFLQQANRGSIHPWLLKEAIKRGMLKE